MHLMMYQDFILFKFLKDVLINIDFIYTIRCIDQTLNPYLLFKNGMERILFYERLSCINIR
jgi:hypothetical protein